MIKWTVRILILVLMPFFMAAAWLWKLADLIFPSEEREAFMEVWRDPESTKPGRWMRRYWKSGAALGEKE